MKELINFYFSPHQLSHNHNSNSFFKNSLVLYFSTIILYSIVSFVLIANATLSTSPVSDSFTFFLIRTIGLLLKEPVQILFLTVSCYLLLNLIFKHKLSFIEIYKLLFVAFNIIIISYFISIINIFTKHYIDFRLINIFKYSLNDLFISIYDCSQTIASLLSRINLLLLLSIFYTFFLFKNVLHLADNKLLMIIIPVAVLLILLLFSAIPMFLLSLIKLAST